MKWCTSHHVLTALKQILDAEASAAAPLQTGKLPPNRWVPRMMPAL
jgi:hypothetical protein